jgi:hypothetical protein
MRRWLIIAGLFILTSGATAVTMGSANAASTYPTAVSAYHAAGHAAQNDNHTVVPLTNYYNIQECSPNKGCVSYQHQCTGTWDTQTAAGNTVTSQCTVRLWLHQYANNTGYTQCINPHAAGAVINNTYRNVLVSSNTGNC